MAFEQTAFITDLLTAMFEGTSDGLCLVAPDGVVLRANENWLRSTKLTREQVVGCQINELFPETRAFAEALHARARAGEHVSVPAHRQLINGEESFWDGAIAPVRMEQGVGLLITARKLISPVVERAQAALASVHEGLVARSGSGDLLSANAALRSMLGLDDAQLALELQRVERDIERRKRSELALAQSEQRFRLMADGLPALIFEFDGPGSVSWLNRAWVELTGLPLEASRGEGWQRCVHPDDLTRVDTAAREAAARGESSLLISYRLRDADGTYHTFRGHNLFIRGVEGAPVRALHASFDVTAEQDAFQRAAHSEARLARALDASTDGFFDLDLDTGVSTRSDRVARLLGMEPAELAQNLDAFFACIHADDLPSFRAETLAAIGGSGARVDREIRARHVDGSYRWLRVRARLDGSDSGSGRHFSGTISDVTERRLAQDALRESEERLQSIFTAMSEGLVLMDAAGRHVTSNGAAPRILGLTQDQLQGRTALDPRWRAVHEDGSPFPGETHPVMVTLRTGQSQRGVIMGVDTPEAGRRWVSISSEPLRHSSGSTPYAVVATFVDITEIRGARERLEQSELRYRTLFENLAEEVSVFQVKRDADGSVTDWILLESNRQARRQLGDERYRAARGRGLIELFGPNMRRIVDRSDVILTGESVQHGLNLFPNSKHYLVTSFMLNESTIVNASLDITARVRAEDALRAELQRSEQIVRELRDALEHVKTLKGLLPICMHCHKIRDDAGYWDRIERYITARTDALFSHSLCPECFVKHYSDV